MNEHKHPLFLYLLKLVIHKKYYQLNAYSCEIIRSHLILTQNYLQ